MRQIEGKAQRALSFGQAAASYDRARPTYPDAALDWLLPPEAKRVLDLGAGTGKLTAALVARGVETMAVDPSRDMLNTLRVKMPNVKAEVGSAEAIPLPADSIDAILVGQAWHWVDREPAVAEAARVLRPAGTLGLVWNVRDARDPLVARLNHILDDGKPIIDYVGTAEVGAPFARLERFDVPWTFALDQAALLDLAASRSRFILMPESDQAAMRQALMALFEQAASKPAANATRRLILPYVTHCFRTRLPR